jgi:urease accessory protein
MLLRTVGGHDFYDCGQSETYQKASRCPQITMKTNHISPSSITQSTLQNSWHGQLDLQFILPQENTATQLIRSYACAPLKVQRPFYPEGDVCHTVLLHTAGGMVGGDRLSYRINLDPNTKALLTTAAAAKIYRSQGEITNQQTQIFVGDNACLEWLPQETIIFDRAQYHQDLRIELGTGAVWCGWEIARLGRSASGEKFTSGQWRNSIEVWQQGQPMWIDRQQVDGSQWDSEQAMAGQPILATMAVIGLSVTPELVTAARELWVGKESSWGISAAQGGVVCRYRGSDRSAVFLWFKAVWNLLRPAYLGRSACIPRVWQM